jgi:hypothetical protein
MSTNKFESAIMYEKLNDNPNKSGILLLQRALDGHRISKIEFLVTKLIRDIKSFNKRKQHPLRMNCTDVLVYSGDFYVQILDNDKYVFEVFDNDEADEMHTKIESESLKDVESYMWNTKANSFFNSGKINGGNK